MIRRLWLRRRDRPFGGEVVREVLVDTDAEPGVPIGDWACTAAELDGADVVFLLHGFNVDRASGEATLDRLAERLRPDLDRLVVPVLWPGDMDLATLQLVSFLSYAFEYDNADEAGERLGDAICAQMGRARRVSFLSHSLGARVVVRAAERVARRRRRGEATPRLGELCLLAPAIDATAFTDPRASRALVAEVEGITVLGSRGDTVLRFVYPLGDLGATLLAFFRDERVRSALGYGGIRPDNPWPERLGDTILAADLGVDHGDYFPGEADADPQRQANYARSARFAAAALTGTSPRWR